MGKQQYFQLLFRLSLILINSLFIFYSYSHDYKINAIGLSLFLCIQVFLFIDYIKTAFADIEKSIDCLLHDDYTNTISKKKQENPLYSKMALLLEKQRKKSVLQSSEELIFSNIIESLSLGILILRKDTTQNIEVFQINKAFTNFLQIPKYYRWNLLKEKLGSLTPLLNSWQTLRHTISLEVNQNKESFFLKTSVTQTNEYEYLVVSLETIQQLIDKKEKEAWYKLMNVMSHEIINTITPISSLAENLDSLLQEDTDEDLIDELSQGLQIIKKRSYHLTSFVDTYRKLAELPLPEKQTVKLNDIIHNTLNLFQQEFINNKIEVLFNSTEPIVLKADKKQLEQVFINLISNCMYALKNINNPTITINAKQENKRTFIHVIDNGLGISDEIKDNIFIPYFTTRKNGSGIGLTLSKSIISAHGGSIKFNSKPKHTEFIITL